MASTTTERFLAMRGKTPDEAGFFWSGGPVEVAERTWFQSRFSGVTKSGRPYCCRVYSQKCSRRYTG